MPTGKVLYDTLENLFFLEHKVKHLFVIKPKFSKYIETNEIYRRMLKVNLPEDEWWKKNDKFTISYHSKYEGR